MGIQFKDSPARQWGCNAKKFFIEPFNEETGEWDKNYRTIYFPIAENTKHLVEGYAEGLKNLYKHDPIEALSYE
jgi:hypothetical protein